MRCEEHAARMKEIRNTSKSLVENPDGERQLEGLRID